MGLGAAVNLQTQVSMLNQANWQLRADDLRGESSPYVIDVHFSSGDPGLVANQELQFRAWNAHLIANPQGPEEESHYVIDLTKPAPLRDLVYGNLGTLIKNAIFARGSMAIRVTDKFSGKVLREQLGIPYNFSLPADAPYNTRVVLRPTPEVTFYGRKTSNDTYILETILVEEAAK